MAMKLRTISLMAAFSGLCVFFGSSWAAAGTFTLDMETGVYGDLPSTGPGTAGIYTQNGFTLSLPDNSYSHSHLNQSPVCTTGGFCWHEHDSANTELIAVLSFGGASFNLTSFEIEDPGLTPTAGSLFSGVLVTPSSGPAVIYGLGVHNVSFTNITNVIFDIVSYDTDTFGGAYNEASLDNIVVDDLAAVPLPTALPLLAGSLSFMGFMGWRRKRTTV